MSPLLLIAAAAAGTQRFALLAGANDGGDGRSILRYAVSDAEAMASVLNDLGSVPPDDTLLLIEPDRNDLEIGFEQLHGLIEQAQATGDRTEVFVYYSGHSDAEGLLLSGDRYGYDELRDALDDLPADMRLLVLDSCSSGAVVRSKGGTFKAPFLSDESNTVSGYAYLTSSSADEVSQEAEQIGGSYFTHALISGLRGGADMNENGRITLREAYDFAHSETLYRTERTIGGAQHAYQDFQYSGTGDLVVTDLSATSARLLIAPGVAGRLSVRDASGRLIAEVLKPGERPLELGLDEGDYVVLLDVNGQLSEARLSLSHDQTVKISAADFVSVGATLAMARGGEGYRNVPFTVGIVPGSLFTKDDRPTIHHFDLSLGVTAADRLNGAQLAIAANVVTEQVQGAQFAVGANIVGGPMLGTQLAAGGNIVNGPVRGIQMAAGMNTTTESLHGLQGAAGLNIAGDGVGLQMAAGPNIARDFSGAQLSSSLNYARSLRGAQIGIINVAGKANAQIGIINIAQDADVALGLISVNKSGYNHLYVLGASADPWAIGATYGGKRLYSLAEYSYRPQQSTMSLGIGWHQPIIPLVYMDVDVAAGSYGAVPFVFDNPGSILRGRMVFGVGFKRLAFFGGPTLHWTMFEGDSGSYQTAIGDLRQGALAVGGQAGIRL
ncbi:MAG: hypothetical protein ACI8RZ_002433 [Myxococcota bacterium]|jgi:hypothetical protein